MVSLSDGGLGDFFGKYDQKRKFCIFQINMGVLGVKVRV